TVPADRMPQDRQIELGNLLRSTLKSTLPPSLNIPDILKKVNLMDTIIGTSPVIAVLRAPDAQDYEPVVETLVDNGVTTIELTLTTPRTLELLPALMAKFADRAHIGVGTVLNQQDAETALTAGSKFII